MDLPQRLACAKLLDCQLVFLPDLLVESAVISVCNPDGNSSGSGAAFVAGIAREVWV